MSSPERQEAAKDFIRWFAQQEIQQEWALFGGYTCNSDGAGIRGVPGGGAYNGAFADTMTKVKDFWNIPIFGQLLELTQRELSALRGRRRRHGGGSAGRAWPRSMTPSCARTDTSE